MTQGVGRTLPLKPASPTALLKPFLTDATGLPSKSTKRSAINFSLTQRMRDRRLSSSLFILRLASSRDKAALMRVREPKYSSSRVFFHDLPDIFSK